jgi:hypothetical protein
MSAIVRARVTGETGRHARRQSCRLERHRFDFHSFGGSCTDAPLRAVFRYPSIQRGLAGRAHFPRSGPSTALMGFVPSQVCSRVRVTRHLRRAGPTCLFTPNPPPRFIFVGVRSSPLLEVTWIEKRRAFRGGFGLGFWAWLPSAVRSAGLRSARGSILPWAWPLSGFRARIRATDRARPRSDHRPPGSFASRNARFASPQSAHGFAAILPKRVWLSSCSVSHIPACIMLLKRLLLMRSPSLQRIDGTDASPARNSFRAASGELPV